MAFWPFGRKSKKQKAEGKMSPARNQTTQSLMRDARSQPVEPIIPTLAKKPSKKESQKRTRSSSRKLTKRRESDMVEPPLPAGPMVDRRDPLNEKILPGATARSVQQLHKVPTDRGDVPSYYFQQMSTTSLQPENFTAIPNASTLSTKRSANDPVLPRRKSSKRRTDDHAREKDIKAMTSPIPIPKRPTSGASGLLARDTKAIPGSVNRNLERPLSDISIPIPDSLASSVSMAADSHGFRVSAFDALSPRPTIRYSDNPRFANGSGSLRPSRTSTRKEKYPAIAEEKMNPRKRIHDLADDMDVGSLKELMERDRRRTEQHRRSDRDKIQHRLQRRADKQRAHERADESEVGLGIEQTPSAPTMHESGGTERRIQDTQMPESWLKDPMVEHGVRTPESWLNDPSRENLVPASPFHDPVAGTGTSHLEAPTPEPDDPEEPVLATATAVRLSQASMSPPTSPMQLAYEPSALSHVAHLASRSTPDIPERPEEQRRDSDTSARLGTNWRSIFRRSGTRNQSSTDRGRTTPSEFSNTSRESFARQMPPSAFTRIPRKRSDTPVRTQSRFKEDLPELPISPPDSRVQSPEAGGQFPPHNLTQARESVTSNPSQPLSDIHPAFREEIALSRHQSLTKGSSDAHSSALVSQSLASVDSEGSWLTGRPVKRTSQTPVNPLRESASSLQRRLQGLGASEGDFRSAENEVVSQDRLTPAPEEVFSKQRTARGLYRDNDVGSPGDSDEEIALQPAPEPIAEEEGTWHSAVGRHPTIVRQGARAKSREGLLNEFTAGEGSQDTSPIGDSPDGQADSPDTPSIQRATSVDIGKGHARHISAGSARLLNLPARLSVDMKRMSASSGERSALGSPTLRRDDETRASDID